MQESGWLCSAAQEAVKMRELVCADPAVWKDKTQKTSSH
ncbi:hypothetical protein EVA_07103 [gut metagenome]|uniref:Uncharacterized protein n=1 Tax=gut metagenome TaxID=749906 RepID=J9GD40_9ZZZZ